jgi:type IV conjugative transfer system coupling protein TraD
MSSLLGTLTEGGQTWAHRIRMFRQVLKIAFVVSFVVGFSWFTYKLSDVNQDYFSAAWYYQKAWISDLFYQDSISINDKFWGQASGEYYNQSNLQIDSKKIIKVFEPHYNLLLEWIKDFLIESGRITSRFFLGMIAFFLVRGLLFKKRVHISGGKRSVRSLLALRLKLINKASHIEVGQLPLLKGSETQHILISGGSGSGKTNSLNEILDQIRAQKQKTIIVDLTGNFVSRYYREDKDIILNPYDKRGKGWSPWRECEENYHFESLVESFIPSSNREDESFWRVGAQTVFCEALLALKDSPKLSTLSNYILNSSLHELYEFLKETPASAFLDPASDRTASSIRAVTSSYLKVLKLVEDVEDPFSIRDWMKKDKEDSWLFISSKVEERDILKPILSAWIGVAIKSLIAMEPDIDRRIWFVIDELPALQKIVGLETFVSEARKFGGCGIFSMQSPSQLESIYGQKSADTIQGNCSTRIAFFERNPVIAEKISRSFGKIETEETQSGLSYGANEIRDGVNLSKQKKFRPLVSVEELMSLKPNNAYVKLQGNWPVTKIKVSY